MIRRNSRKLKASEEKRKDEQKEQLEDEGEGREEKG